MSEKQTVMTQRCLPALLAMSVTLFACATDPDAPGADGDARSEAEATAKDASAGRGDADAGTNGMARGARDGGVADAGARGSGGTGGTAGASGGGAGAARADAGSGVDSPDDSNNNPGVASNEDEGADCQIAALPEANSLPSNDKLPDPFTKLDGKPMSTQAEWRCRRQEIKGLAEKFGYGAKPAKPVSVSGTVSNTSVTVEVSDNGKSASFSVSVKLPGTGAGPYPAIIVYGGGGFGAPLDNAVITSEGIAMITYNPYDVGKEGTPRNNKQGAFYSIAGSNSSTGLLVAWAWGVSRIIDVIEQSDATILKPDAIAVTGCSRFGKGSLVAGVFDQRVALTMPIESGSGGVPIWRGIPGEGAQSLSSAYGEQPWMGDAFGSFTSKPASLPFDTHELVAMVAPRGLFIMDNPHIANLGPKSAHVAALAGAEVYKALGAGDNITYHSDVQNGSHCAVRPEWSPLLRSNIQRFLKRSGNAAGVIKAASKASGNLSDWRTWQTPVLQ